jgi:hypothetical protein
MNTIFKVEWYAGIYREWFTKLKVKRWMLKANNRGEEAFVIRPRFSEDQLMAKE